MEGKKVKRDENFKVHLRLCSTEKCSNYDAGLFE